MPFSLQPSLAAALDLMLSRSLRMSAAIEMFAFHARRTVMALVAILCPVCVHVGFARAEPLPRVLTCSRCHHKQNFSRPTPRQRSTDGNRYATDGLMPYGSRQPGRPTLHVDLGAPTLTTPGAARSDGAQITLNSFAWVQMEHRHRASIHRERTPRRYTRDLSRVLGLRECQEFG